MLDDQKSKPSLATRTDAPAPFRVAAVQMVSGPDVTANLAQAAELVAQAAALGARLVALPEYFAILGMKDTDKVAARESDGAGPIQRFLAETARAHGIWLLGGSVPLESATEGKVHNSSLLYDDRGERIARYDKIHLFGLDLGTEKFSEARTIVPGSDVKVVDSPFGRLGLSICYDVRFPELYRAMGAVDVIFVPSAFTATTGRAHWEPLMRARAIENLAWVIAPAQGGLHPNGRTTHGHSMIIDPWGAIVAERAGGPGVVIAEIDPIFQARMRASLPALEHRTLAGV
jgi:deaminated glutathione amidase